jgi:hypothetical protein
MCELCDAMTSTEVLEELFSRRKMLTYAAEAFEMQLAHIRNEDPLHQVIASFHQRTLKEIEDISQYARTLTN